MILASYTMHSADSVVLMRARSFSQQQISLKDALGIDSQTPGLIETFRVRRLSFLRNKKGGKIDF